MKKKYTFLILLILIFTSFAFYFNKFSDEKEYKVLYIASYHKSMRWVRDIERGIREAFNNNHMTFSYKAFYMDSKRKTSKSEILNSANKAKELIKSWNPDIIIVSDENALVNVVLPMKDTKFKFVFCGINGKSEDYGVPTSNITGVLERHHFVDAVRIMKLMDPHVEKVAVISEDSISSKIIIEQLKQEKDKIPVEISEIFLTNSFDDWKKFVIESGDKYDALMIILFFSVKNKDGASVNSGEIIRWTTSNSAIPAFSTFSFFVKDGGLLAVAVNGFSQGYKAGKIACKVLKGASPLSIKPSRTVDGIIFINATRAKELNLNLPIELYQSTNIVW